jgi:hypothetical protein
VRQSDRTERTSILPPTPCTSALSGAGPGDATVSAHESEAIGEIDHAIAELKRAAIDDGKNIHDHPSADVPNDYRGRLHKAADLLRKVHSDTYREEDNPDARGLRDRAIGLVDAALHATEQAIHDVEAGR